MSRDIASELSRLRSAQSGWKKARSAGKRLQVMRLLRRTADSEARDATKKRKAARGAKPKPLGTNRQQHDNAMAVDLT